MDQEFELKVAKLVEGGLGRPFVVRWNGHDGINASERWVDCHRDCAVIAWRPIRHGLFVGAPGPGSDR